MNLGILLADDHHLFRDALRVLLERDTRFSVVAETGDGLEVLKLAHQSSPHIVCMDIDMPGLNGIEITRQMSSALPAIKVIGLSTFSDRGYVTAMLGAGASAYVTKRAAGVELLRAIEAVSRNRSYLCPDATDAVRESMAGNVAASWREKNQLA
jgi:DNA-binding NarL/FixJ family response regulator